jgi:hypothetical protein
MTVSGDFAAQVRRLVETTCADQGVPLHVTDCDTVERVVVLLSGSGGGDARKCVSAGTSPAPARSEAPHRSHALDRDRAGSPDAWEDLDVVDQCFDDGALPVEVEVGPLLAQQGSLADVGVDVPRAG